MDANPVPGLTRERISADTPIPFLLHQLWFDLHCAAYQTFVPDPAAADVICPAYVLDLAGAPVQLGDPAQVIPPLYKTVKTSVAERVRWGLDPLNFRRKWAFWQDGSVPCNRANCDRWNNVTKRQPRSSIWSGQEMACVRGSAPLRTTELGRR